jgi:alpha-tubulin suppressor-like RCC1 family protein
VHRKIFYILTSMMVLLSITVTSPLEARGSIISYINSVGASSQLFFEPIVQTSKTHDSISLNFPNPRIVVTATQVSAGGSHTCAILEDKSIKCWGYGSYGQLGDGSTADSPIPVSVSGITNATQVAAGGMHTCALLEDKNVKCWGRGTNGQLGDGSTADSSIPVSVSGITNATQLSTRYDHTCAHLEDKTIKCWGEGASWQNGNGSTADAPVPVIVSGITNATQVSAGGGHTCALLEDKNIKCWGRGSYGQLGDGSTADSPIPVSVSGITNATQVAAGYSYTCAALIDETTKCWGRGSYGQLGDGTQTSRPTPAYVKSLTTASQIAAGYNHACALLDDRSINCWGLGTSGEIGNGQTIIHKTPKSVLGLSAATQVSAGGNHTCALSVDKTIECWGLGSSGQLGDGTNISRTTPTLVLGDFESIEKYKIEWSEDGLIWESQESTTTTAMITGLKSGTLYQVRVSAYLVDGWSEPFSAATMDTISPPQAPGQPTKSNVNATSVDLTWLTPYAHELSVDKYKVEWSINGSTWQNLETQELQASITGLSSATSYQVRVSAHSLAGYGEPSQAITVATTGTRSMRFTFKMDDGRPLTGGAVSWALNDESYSSATNYGVPSTGVLDFPRVAAGTGTITVNNAQLPTGEYVSSIIPIELGQSIHVVTFPAPTDKGSFRINVRLPNGEPVLGAAISVDGLYSRKWVGRAEYSLPSASSGSTNDQGTFLASGFVSGTPRAKVTYNDGVLVQSKFVDLTSATTNVVLDEMPWLEVNESAQTVSSGSLVSVPVSLKGVSSKSGYTLSITAPSGSSQTCKGRVLTAKTNSSGKATLKVCANKSGTYKVKAKGAVSTGVVQLKVKNAAPLPVTGVTARSTSLGSATVAWSAPSYTGGASITGYKVMITGGGKTYTKTTTARSHTFTGLKNATQYTVTVEAITKYGSSSRVTVRVGVA